MDADTTLDEGFLDGRGPRGSTDDRALMAVGGLFYGEDGSGPDRPVPAQRVHPLRPRDRRRRRGRVFVLTGTASIFRPRALRTVAAERGRSIPGVPGDVYDTLALTEDNELTLAIKSLGGLMISPHRVHSGHRGDADLARAVGPAAALAAWSRWRTSALRVASDGDRATGPNSSASDTGSSRSRPTCCSIVADGARARTSGCGSRSGSGSGWSSSSSGW